MIFFRGAKAPQGCPLVPKKSFGKQPSSFFLWFQPIFLSIFDLKCIFNLQKSLVMILLFSALMITAIIIYNHKRPRFIHLLLNVYTKTFSSFFLQVGFSSIKCATRNHLCLLWVYSLCWPPYYLSARLLYHSSWADIIGICKTGRSLLYHNITPKSICIYILFESILNRSGYGTEGMDYGYQMAVADKLNKVTLFYILRSMVQYLLW